MGAHMGVGEGPKNRLFLICPPLGVPGFIFLDFWPPWASFWAFFEGRPAPATHRQRTVAGAARAAPATGNPNLKPTWLQRGGGVGPSRGRPHVGVNVLHNARAPRDEPSWPPSCECLLS